MTTLTDWPFVVGPGEGIAVSLAGQDVVHKVPAGATRGRVAVVEHTVPPRTLAAPLHRHAREDELSFVLSGRLSALLGDDVVTAAAGSYVLKPRHQWHTVWNGGDEPLRFVELLLPGGLEDYYGRLAEALRGHGGFAEVDRLALEFGIECDFDATADLAARLGLRGWRRPEGP